MDKQNSKHSRLAVTALCSVLFLATRIASAEGAGAFACHVVAENGQPGVFFVQTNDKDEAGESALRARVMTTGHVKAQVVEVVECVHYPEGRFSDAAMRAYLKKLPT